MEISIDYLLATIGKKQVLIELKDAEIAQLRAELKALTPPAEVESDTPTEKPEEGKKPY